MKKFRTSIAVALILMSMTAMAQGPGRHKMRSATENATWQTIMLVKSLELNAEQTMAIQKINMKYAINDSVRFAEFHSNQSKEKFDRDSMIKIMKEQRAAHRTEIESVLTDTQKAKYEELEKERQSHGPGFGHDGGGQPPMGGREGGQDQD